MARALTIAVLGTSIYLATAGVASAGTILPQGNVIALDDVTQITSVTGSALLDEAYQGPIAPDQYPGLTINSGELGVILPGVVEMGDVPEAQYTSPGVYFPYPIAGGGVQTGYICLTGGALTFDDPVTQFGLTAGGLVTMFITAWDQNGVMLGQVTWTPEDNEAAFVGIDTMGVPIGLLTIGSDNVWGGEPYDDLGASARSDNWMWGTGVPCQTETDCFEDTWACTGRACNAGACEYAHTTEPCDDLDACTMMDTCADGICGGSPVDCTDNSVCTFDTCDAIDGCSNEPIEGCCFTDEDCPEGDMCLVASNTCVPGPPPPPPPPPAETDTGGGEETTAAAETTGPAAEEGGGGCSCTTSTGTGGVLLGLFALLSLAGLRRRDD